MKKPLIMLAGLPGVGKTTIRNKLLEALKGYDVYDNTQVRRDFGFTDVDPKIDYLVLQEVNRRTIDSIKKERGVILDSVHRYRKRREELYNLASENNSEMLIMECICSEEEAKRRLKCRDALVDGLVTDTNSPKVYDRLKKEWEDIMPDLQERQFLSYINFDTESKILKKLVVRPNLTEYVNFIESVL